LRRLTCAFRGATTTPAQAPIVNPIYNNAVEGLDDNAARLIVDLTELAAQPRLIYKPHWEPRDVLMRDNRCTIHAVTPHDPAGRRIMHHTTILGDQPALAA
jgi:alpha-ketoglutarate-dependent taurine dioxygenase